MRDRNHELMISLFTSKLMRSDSKNCTIKKNYQFNPLTASPLTFTASLPKQKHLRAKSRQVRRLTARRKNHYHDFVTYPEVLCNCVAWTSAWVNQKGYVTNSYNVTHDEKKNPITILLHIPKFSATVLHGLQPG